MAGRFLDEPEVAAPSIAAPAPAYRGKFLDEGPMDSRLGRATRRRVGAVGDAISGGPTQRLIEGSKEAFPKMLFDLALNQLNDGGVGGAVKAGVENLGPPALDAATPALDVAGEITPAIPSLIPINMLLNASKELQEGDVKGAGPALLEALPFGQLVKTILQGGDVGQLDSLTAPINLRRGLTKDAITAIKPDFDPSPLGEFGLDVADFALAGGSRPGQLVRGARKRSLGRVNKELADRSAATRAAEATGRMEQRAAAQAQSEQQAKLVDVIRQRFGQQQASLQGLKDRIAGAPKALPPPSGSPLGPEGPTQFLRVPKNVAREELAQAGAEKTAERVSKLLQQAIEKGPSKIERPFFGSKKVDPVPQGPLLKEGNVPTQLEAALRRSRGGTPQVTKVPEPKIPPKTKTPPTGFTEGLPNTPRGGAILEDYKSAFKAEQALPGVPLKDIFKITIRKKVPGSKVSTSQSPVVLTKYVKRSEQKAFIDGLSKKEFPLGESSIGIRSGVTPIRPRKGVPGKGEINYDEWKALNHGGGESGGKAASAGLRRLQGRRGSLGKDIGKMSDKELAQLSQRLRKSLGEAGKTATPVGVSSEVFSEVERRGFDFTRKGLKNILDREDFVNTRFGAGTDKARDLGNQARGLADRFKNNLIRQRRDLKNRLTRLEDARTTGDPVATRANLAKVEQTQKEIAAIQKKIEAAPDLLREARGGLSRLKGRRGSLGKDVGKMSDEELAQLSQRLRKSLGEGAKERKFIGTVRESPRTAPEVAKEIQGEFRPISNKQSMEEAVKIINRSEDKALKMVLSDAKATRQSNTVAQVLMDKSMASGNMEQAINIAEKTAAKATDLGQAIQALSIYGKLSNPAMLRFAQRVYQKANKLNPKLNLRVSKELAQHINRELPRIKALPTARQRAIGMAQLMQKIHKPIPANFLQKVSMVQTLSQLLNLKTAGRNIIGNAGFAAFENLSDVVGTAVDKVVGKFTGVRTQMLPNLRVQARGAKRGFRQAMEEIDKGVIARTSPTAGTQFDLPKEQVFKGGVGRKLEKWLNVELRAPDRAAYEAARRGSLLNQIKAAKVKRPTPAMQEKAHLDGLIRTFQDNNAISKGFVKIKKGLNELSSPIFGGKDFGIGDLTLKYPKTPGALAFRGIEYTPTSFIKSVLELAKPVMGKTFNQAAFVRATSRGLVGSATVGTGILLARAGILTGRKKVRKSLRGLYEKTGQRNYSINVDALKRYVASGFDAESAKKQDNDFLASYDWFQPSAIPLAVGANIHDNKADALGTVVTIVDAVHSGANTLAEQPLISGTARLFGYGDIPGGVGKVLQGAMSSFTPSLLNQFRLLIDDVQKDVGADNPFVAALRQVQRRIPGFSKNLKPQRTPFGEPRELRIGKGLGRAFNVFLNPAITSRLGESPNSDLAEELIRLDVGVSPQTRSISRGGEKFPLTNDQRLQVNEDRGKIVAKELRTLFDSPRYDRWSERRKEKRVKAIVRNAGDDVRDELVKSLRDKQRRAA